MNPFKILGLQPHILKGLSDEEAYALVKSLYRSLMQVHHPDIGGSEAKSRRLNEAMEELDFEKHPKQFAEWRTLFQKPRREQFEETEGGFQKAAKEYHYRAAKLERALMSSWEERWFPSSPPEEMAYLKPVPLTHLAGKLLVSNTMEQFILERAISRERGVGPQNLEPVALPSGFMELAIDKNGVVAFRKATRYEVPITKKKDVPGGLRWTHTKHTTFLYWIVGGEEEARPDVKIVGGIDPRSARFADDRPHIDVCRRLLSDSIPEKHLLQKAVEGFALDVFRPFLPFVRPEVGSADLVVGLRKTSDGKSLFLILGSAISWQKE